MNLVAKIIAPIALAAFASAQAQTPTTMTCSSGGTASLTLPITGITFDLPTGSPMGYFTVTANFSEFNYLANAHFSTPAFDSCSFAPGNGTSVYGITISDVAAHADGSQQYSQITLSYGAIGIGPSGTVATIPALKVPMTAEQKQRALADYLARLPKPSTVSK